VTSVANAFDPRTVLLAKHAQHIVLVHFPIALFLTGVALGWAAQWTKREALAEAAYYNLLIAAASTLPVLVTGVLAWQLQLEGQRLKGVLLLHLMLGCTSSVLICAVWWLHHTARRRSAALPRSLGMIEGVAVLTVALTGHLGGFLSGVNGG
jgi:uncharacterized membrane protein